MKKDEYEDLYNKATEAKVECLKLSHYLEHIIIKLRTIISEDDDKDKEQLELF